MKPAYTYLADVVRVIDGDTIVFDIDLGMGVTLKNQPIRLQGVNAPELIGASAEAGRAARDFALAALLLPDAPATFFRETIITTFKDKNDKYGRLLAKVFIKTDQGWVCLNDEMLRTGHATPYV
jgi:endonuclease YncB( thermonuclease family)